MNLNFFTAEFPYGNSETFIENELPYLSEAFENVQVFAHLERDLKTKRKLEENCSLVNLKSFELSTLSFKYYLIVYYFFFIELFKANHKWFYIKNTKRWLSLLSQGAKKAQYIEKHNLLLPNSINYSFWMNDWALVLAILKKRNIISSFVFRCGGFDIWNERHEGDYLPFRGVIYKYATKVMPNTILGETYIKKLKLFPTKIEHKYWGTTDNGLGMFRDEAQLTLVSVSNVIPLKRVHLIIEVLKNVAEPINWIHFGKGDLLDEITKMAKVSLPQHNVIFKGSIPNIDIMRFYQNNSVDLFMTTSSTEGMPVSIQEALSFGVPIIATDVGGISEMINNDNGLLINKEFDPKEVALFIENYKKSEFCTLTKRHQIREGWKSKFDAKIVYTKFAKELQNY